MDSVEADHTAENRTWHAARPAVKPVDPDVWVQFPE
jgi:hypothetical protein